MSPIKWYTTLSTMMMCSSISVMLLASILGGGEAISQTLSFKSLNRTQRLPVWLSYITTEHRPDHGIADTQAIQQIRHYQDKNRMPEIESKFQNVINKASELHIADPIAAFVNDWSTSTDCQRNSFSADAYTNTVSTFTTSEEKVMVFTLIRIMASYLFDHKDELVINLNTTTVPALDIKFEIPDLELIPAYYVMLKVHKNSKGRRCDGKS